ncbi:MAG: hypothetical protein VX199_04140, partial [Chloroflexota bacterium]|nr:hypothetical protein [Chloroflexota bacterium]
MSGFSLRLSHALLYTAEQTNSLLVISVILWATVSVLGHFLLNMWVPNRDLLMFPITTLLTGWGM